MIKKSLVSLVIFVSFFTLPNIVSAGTITLPNPLCQTDAAGMPIDPNNCIKSLPELIAKITDYISNVVAALAVLMFIWAGILFLTSAGDTGRVDRGKKAAIYAAIGAGIALAGKGLAEVIKAVIGAAP